MYIYNVTINVDESVHDQWLDWMRGTHIPDMLATGKFSRAKLCKVLLTEEMGGITYAIQYSTPNRETLQAYYELDAPRLRKATLKKFKDKFVVFRTELEVIDLQETGPASATHYLFCYGTLQDPAVQLQIFSRKWQGSEARLPGYTSAPEKIAGLYPVIVPSQDPKESVKGEVYLISAPELVLADTYEGVGYKRIRVLLNSGIEAWVYVQNPNLFQP